MINKSRTKRDKLNQEKGRLERDMQQADTARQKLTLLDESNKKTQLYLTCARRIYDELNEVYTSSETKIRNQLQNTINDIFKQIYEGGLSLTIDEKYHITVQANDYEGDVETSTAQSISVIFAFITGFEAAHEYLTSSRKKMIILGTLSLVFLAIPSGILELILVGKPREY